jgi:hypothetical protein
MDERRSWVWVGSSRRSSVEIAGREFEWQVDVEPQLVLPEHQGPPVSDLVDDYELVERPEVRGQYFRRSSSEVNNDDFEVLSSVMGAYRNRENG